MDKTTLGKQLGIVPHTASITNDAGDKTTVSFNIDFRGASDDMIKSWLASNRTISGQRVWRALTRDDIKKLVGGKTFSATSIGQKLESDEKRIEKLVAVGLPRPLAEKAVKNPAMFDELVAKMENASK